MNAVAEQELTSVPETEAKEQFHITDESSANWLLRQLANIEAEKNRVRQQAADIVRSLESDATRLNHLYASELEQWVKSEVEKSQGRKKSIKLLQGTCAFRTVPGRLSLMSEQEAHFYAMADVMEEVFVSKFNPAAYLDIAEKRLEQTGELLPGIEIVAERESFSIKFGKEKE